MPTDRFAAPDYTVSRFLIERGLAAIYLVAFLVAARQFRPLLGERGLLPVPAFVRLVRFRQAPSLFHWRYSDRLLSVVAWTGVVVSAALLLGLPQRAPLPVAMLAWVVPWALYLSIVNVGQLFYGYGWESLLLEAGFLAIFLGNDATAPPWLVILLFRWLAFRVEFGAGLIKLRGDPCWRDLTCMDYHHETQPMPNPVSWFVHRLPQSMHRAEAFGNFVAQLVAPVLLFLPQPVAGIGAVVMVLTQLYLVVTGNYAWLNWVTIVASLAGLSDAFWGPFAHAVGMTAATGVPPAWYVVLVVALTVLVAVLSYAPAMNLLGRRGQLMNASFDPLHLVNTYGAFGSVTRVRDEVVVEGTADESPDEASEWREYGFRGKPGDVRRMPPQVAPYHLRLDWQMWFLPFNPYGVERWFLRFAERLLEGDRGTLGLLRHNPFPDAPPRYVRARMFEYRYATREERRRTGSWWVRKLIGEYLPAIRLRTAEELTEATSGRGAVDPGDDEER